MMTFLVGFLIGGAVGFTVAAFFMTINEAE